MKNLIACLVVCVLSSVVAAEVHHVPADFPTIQYAIDAALDGDEIIVAPGTYTSTADEVVDMLGKEIWLHSSKGAQVTIIDGEGVRRGILCDSGETSKTIVEGLAINNGYDFQGGGMSNFYSSPTLIGCTFTNNTATTGGDGGGGMYNYESSPTLIGCTFTANFTIRYGGGMHNLNSSPTLTNCTFTANRAGVDGFSGGQGGGMFNTDYSNPTLTNCTFDSNIATGSHGGGMCNNDSSSLTLTNCTFTNNTAYYSGGGMYNYYCNLTLTYCTFESNISGWNGGGIHNYYSNGTLTHCTLTGNYASLGAGMFNEGSNPMLTDTTVCGNTPDQIYGDWTDGGFNIIADMCPVSTEGACCTNDGCVVSEEEDCFTFLGQWLGEDIICDSNPCLTECPGDLNSDGQVNVNDLMILIAYWGACP